MDNTALYYDKFLTLVCEYWRDEIKSAAPGHCMKITGLPMQELKKLLPKLRLINPDIDIYILSDDLKGANTSMQRNSLNFVTMSRRACWCLSPPTAAHLPKTPMAMLPSKTLL